MMNIYQDILSIDEATFDELMTKGLLRPTAKRELEMYAYYLKECNNNSGKMQALINTADKFHSSDSSVKRIVYKLRKTHIE